MKNQFYKAGIILLAGMALTSCLKDIDTVPIPRTIEETFTVQHSIRRIQSYYKFYKNTVLEVDTALYTLWDLAFESAGSGSRVLLGWASYSVAVPSGKFDFGEITQDLILDLIDNSDDWDFDDPSYLNNLDSLVLPNHWEDGEIYIQNRGLTRDNYYAFQYVSSDEVSYTIRYASALSLGDVKEVTINRSSGFNYVYFSYSTGGTVQIEPPSMDWDILFTPYSGWWETSDSGIYSPYNVSGVLINNEAGVRVARVFDPDISFSDIDMSFIPVYEFTDMKGAIGSNWKILGAVGSSNLYTMDPDKKYIIRKFDTESNETQYFKIQIVDYKLNGEDHFPTVEFKYLGSE